MGKPTPPQIVTANDLLSGEVIYMRADGSWTPNMDQAQILDTPEQAITHLSHSQTQHHKAVGAYLAPVQKQGDTVKPEHFREDFRRKGPSNYAHGKQEQAHV